MTTSTITPVTDDALEAFLPLARARSLCFVNNNRQDDTIKDYRRAAFADGCFLSRSSILPQELSVTYRTPYPTVKNFGIEAKVVDLDGVRSVVRLPNGPIISVDSVTFLDASGALKEVLPGDKYILEESKFLRWNAHFEWLDWLCKLSRPMFTIRYHAGFVDSDPRLASLRVAVGEVLAAKWDAQGGNYKMPTSARYAFNSLRGSRTYLPATTEQRF